MLFSSWIFLFCFLPAAILGYAVATRFGRVPAMCWLIAMSLVFYGYWKIDLVLLIGVTILFNYAAARLIRRWIGNGRRQSIVLWTAIAANLGALIYYKYALWLLSLLGEMDVAVGLGLRGVALPLGISFFTFTQIAYLIDCRYKKSVDTSFLNYGLFVTFFPHLIAGPLYHCSEIMPQFADPKRFRLNGSNVAVGLTVVAIGLFKKSLIADSLSGLNESAFNHAAELQFLGSWAAALGYSLQLYFDFSGYSDMATGLALIFNIKLPLNFNSPYKSRSMIEYWQRWHMTLTRYITQYLYNPIAMIMSRRRAARGLPMGAKALAKPWPFVTLVGVPTFVSIMLAGIWHGAGMQFVVFGLMHVVYLLVNHGWRTFGPKPGAIALSALAARGVAVSQVLLTYLAVVVSQVFFRAANLADAREIAYAMIGGKGLEDPLPLPGPLARLIGALFGRHAAPAGPLQFHNFSSELHNQALFIVGGFVIVWFFPNCYEIMAEAQPTLVKVRQASARLLRWRPTPGWAVLSGAAAAIALLSIAGVHEFLYFQF